MYLNILNAKFEIVMSNYILPIMWTGSYYNPCLSEEVIEDIRVANSASRNIARTELSEEVIEDIRVANSASRILARSNLPNHNLNGLFWGSINDRRQRVQVPDNIPII